MFQYGIYFSSYNCENLISWYNGTENEDEHEENVEFSAVKINTVSDFFSTVVAQNKDFENLVFLFKIQTYWFLVIFVAYLNSMKSISQIISKTVRYHEDIVEMWLASESPQETTYSHERYLEFRDEGVEDHIKNVTKIKNYVKTEILSFLTILINILICVNVKNNSYNLFTQTELVWNNHLKLSETHHPIMECLREQQDQLQYGYFIVCCVCVFTGLVNCINMYFVVKSFYLHLAYTYIYHKTRPIQGLYFHYLLCIYVPGIYRTDIVPTFYEFLLIKHFEDSGFSFHVNYIVGNIYLSRYSTYAESLEV